MQNKEQAKQELLISLEICLVSQFKSTLLLFFLFFFLPILMKFHILKHLVQSKDQDSHIGSSLF